jgi:hypothetical protein
VSLRGFMKVRFGIVCAWLLTLLCCTLSVALGDQADSGDDSTGGVAGADQPTTRQDDDRLPAVLPGEEVVTQTGQKMRVWSSAGPVPINQQPTPQPWGGGGYGDGGPAVIVDGRGFEGRGVPGR